MNREQIFDAIIEERARQDVKWGGPQHDDQHTSKEFADIIVNRTIGGMNHFYNEDDPIIKGFIQTAAVAVAAIESRYRKMQRLDEASKVFPNLVNVLIDNSEKS